MKFKICTALLTAAALFTPLSLVAEKAQNSADAKRAAVEVYGKLPLSFEPTESTARFLAHSGGYAVSVGVRESSVAVTDAKSGKTQTLRFAFDNANLSAPLEAIEPLPGVTNYYLGQDSSKWRLGVKNYAKVRAQSVYPGVDVVYYGDHRRLEFDFVVAPKADPRAIALSFSGMEKFYKDADGDLVAEINGQAIHFVKPYAYQKVAGVSKPVAVDYELASAGSVHLRLGAYDRNSELIVDPVVKYATYLGGSGIDLANGIAVDSANSAYVTGQTFSADFPDNPNPGFSGASDAYVTKFDRDGAYVYTTIVGGADKVPDPVLGFAMGSGIALDASGQAYIIGSTSYRDLPPLPTVNSYQGGDSDAFITILDSNGNLVRTAYLGGSSADVGFGIAVDTTIVGGSPVNSVSVVGQTCSSNFPAYASIETKIEACVAFITKLDNGLHIPVVGLLAGQIDPTASAVSPAPGNVAPATYYFSGFFGGQPVPPFPSASWLKSGQSFAPGAIIIDSNAPPDVQYTVLGGTSGSAIWNPTKLGLTSDGTITWQNIGAPAIPSPAFTVAYGVALDPRGDVFIAGGTTTSVGLSSPFIANYSGYPGSGAWVLKLNGQLGTYVYGTPLETNPSDLTSKTDAARAIAVDTNGFAYVAGTATGTVLTTGNAYKQTVSGHQDAFLVRMNNPGSAIDYATYLGGTSDDQGLGVAVDANLAAYVVGVTKSADFPIINPLTNPNSTMPLTLNGLQDAFITKFTADGSALIFSAYFGGSDIDQANAIAVDPTNLGNMYVAGNTSSLDLETTLNLQPAVGPPVVVASYIPQQNSYKGKGDAFVLMVPSSSLPAVSVTPGSLNFTDQDLNTPSAPQAVQYTNTNGVSAVDIQQIQFSNGDFKQDFENGTTGDCTQGLVLPSKACNIWVVFTPTVGGTVQGTLTITDGTSSTSHVINLSGQTAMPVDAPSVASLTFKTVQAVSTTSAPQPVTLQNTGSGTLYITGIAASGDFAQTSPPPNTCGAQVPSHGNCIILVTFTPSGVLTRTGNLTITDNAPGSPHVISLTGTGTLVTSTIAPSFLSYVQQAINAPSLPQTVTITNTSTDPTQALSVSAVAISGDYAIVGNTCIPTVPFLTGATPPSCTIQVVFDPTIPGARPGTLTISGNGTAMPYTIPLNGTAGAMMLPLTPPTFVATNIGATNIRTVTLANQSTVSMNVLGIAVSGAAAPDFTLSNDCGTSVKGSLPPLLPATDSFCTITATFKPSTLGNRDAVLTVTTDAANSPQTVALAGVGTQPAATLTSVTTPVFGNQTLNTPSAPSPITLTNTATGQFFGNLNILAGSITITGAAANDFTIAPNSSCAPVPAATVSLLPAASCTINVVFQPSAVGSRIASLTITDDASPSTQTIALVGTALQPSAPTVALPTFASQAVNTTSIPGNVVVTNTDPNVSLIVSAASVTGDFLQSVPNPCPTPVAPNTSCTIPITFTPTAPGTRTGTLTISGNGAGMPTIVTLTGIGGVVTTLTPTTANFTGNVGTTSAAQTVALSNTGSFPLSVQSVAIVPTVLGDVPGDYVLTNNCPNSLPASTICLISVAFKPTAGGNRNATLTVTTNAATSPQSVSLLGVGTQAVASLSVVAPGFANKAWNVASTGTVTLTNTGTGTLNILGGIAFTGPAASDYTTSTICPPIVQGTPCNIVVSFTPSALGSRIANLVITDDSLPNTQTIALGGTGVLVNAPTVILSPNSFTYQQVNHPIDGIVTITNTDSQNLLVSAASISGDFVIKTNNCSTVVPNVPCTLLITFTPTASGTRTGTLTLSGNATGMPSSTIITGTAGADLKALNPLPSFTANINETEAAQTITLKNNSGFTVNVPSIGVSGLAANDFSQTNSCGTSIQKNASCQVNVAFKPSALGNRNAAITVTSDAAISPLSVNLLGTGTSAAVNLSATTLTFPTQPLNIGSSAQTITITNPGVAQFSGPLNISASGIKITGPAANDYAFALTNCVQVLNVGPACSISLVFTPSALGSRNATLNIADDEASSPQMVALDGTGGSILLSIAPPSALTFPPYQQLNQLSPWLPVTIANNDTNALALGIPVFTGDFQAVPLSTTCTASLAAGKTCVIAVAFNPTAVGTRTGTLTISGAGIGLPAIITLTGIGGANTSLSTPVNFTANTGTSSPSQAITLTNLSGFTFGVQNIALGGAAVGDFSQTNNCGSSVLAAPAYCNIYVTFKPTTTGNRDATLTINSGAAAPIQTIALLGVGTAPVVTLSAGTTGSATNLTFTTVQPLHVASAAQVITLINKGSGALNIPVGGITFGGTVPGDFSQTNDCGTQVATVASGYAGCNIFVIFTPSASDSRSATLVITDDAVPSPQIIALLGTGASSGTGEGTGSGTILLSSATLPFGNQTVNTSITQTVTLTNSSTISALTISGMMISGPNSADFSGTDNCPATLAAGAKCQMQLTFTPTNAAAESATLTITGSASNSPATVTMTGTGIVGSVGGIAPPGSNNYTLTSDSTGVSVTQGITAVYSFSVAPLSGSKDLIAFTCSGPVGSNCSVSPASLQMDGSTTSIVKLNVNTTGGNGVSAKSIPAGLTSRSIFFAVLPFSMMGMLLINKRRSFWLVLMLVALCLAVGMVGCGSPSASKSNSSAALAPGTYQVTFTATSNGTTPVVQTLNLVVNKQ